MKLNTLLLTSTATLMTATVAFAADLPSKKAAPSAGSVQICKVGGMTGFTLPGSDTCLGISGRVTYDASYSDTNVDLSTSGSSVALWTAGLPAVAAGPVDADGANDWSQGGGYRIGFDVRSNTEIGVVRGFLQNNGGLRRAFVQFAGFTAGVKDSIADIVGTNPNIAGPGYSQAGTGIDYQVAVGGLNFGLGLEQGADVNRNDASDVSEAASSATSGDRPDIVAHLSGTAGAMGFAVAAVSHQSADLGNAVTHDGYAVIGRLNGDFGGFGLRVWGAMSDGASAYTGNYLNTAATAPVSGMVDFEDGNTLEGRSFGGEVSFKMGKATTLYVLGRHNEHEFSNSYDALGSVDSWSEDQFGVQIVHQLAKNLTIQPEYVYTRGSANEIDITDGGTVTTGSADYDSSTFAIRIERDF